MKSKSKHTIKANRNKQLTRLIVERKGAGSLHFSAGKESQTQSCQQMDTHQDIKQKKDATSVICDAEGDTNHPNREEGRRRDDGRCCGDGGVVWIVAASLQKVQRVPGCLAMCSYLHGAEEGTNEPIGEEEAPR